ncbi:MAG: TetR/AcrR family transcriptional regulator [Polyangiaceae bacterium]
MAAVDKKERRQALLKAARDVFASRGYHDAKVEDICDAANVAKGTYYLYFKDKRTVLEELIDSLFARLGGAILRVDVERDVRAQIEHNIRAIVAVFLDDPALTKILLSYAAGLDPAFVRKIASFYETTRRLLRDALREGQRLGIVADGDPEFYATVSLGIMKEVLHDASHGNKARSREDIVEKLFGFLEGGYLRAPREAQLLPAEPPAPTPVVTAAPVRRRKPPAQ